MYCTALVGVVNKLNNILESYRRFLTGVWRLAEDLSHVLGNHFSCELLEAMHVTCDQASLIFFVTAGRYA